ncbi:DUF4554 domain-containing protein isoform X2 [Syngnathoides biaculeatus]|uniref:DUF4554 domain-containing protein isoform X2 n=1 Tax=Syngnathoides biaculeatus TaxID=300417 RepID=UPI002ADE408B|nr:DUF4554 domain-containing protein isoform X2 [Syngnathoides biaculeatus]
MLEQIKQALQLFILLGKKGQYQGGLLVLLWAEPGAANCTVAAAGSKWRRIQLETFQNVLTDVKFSCSGTIPEPDPEELRAFTDVHGSLKLLLSFQVKDLRFLSPQWPAHIKAFLSLFSLVNAGTRVHLRCKFPQTVKEEFRANFTRRLTLAMGPTLMLDVTCSSLPVADNPVHVNGNKLVKKGSWCPGGHPVLGSILPLRIPPETMDNGLYGELNMQLVALLSPCVLQYPNLETLLTHVEVLTYPPSRVPMTFPSAFFRNLFAHLDSQEFGELILRCLSSTDRSQEGSIVFAVEDKTCQEPEKRLQLNPVKQKLLIFLFLQHTDPFISQLSDFMDTEALIERHLEDILNKNRQAVTGALHTELSNTWKAQVRKKKNQEKLLSAAKVILSASINVVSSSTNLNFRLACLNRMQVSNTHELGTSLREALLRVTSWRCVPRKTCYSAQVEEQLENAQDTREEN